jgi:hypothetical protein
LGPIRTIVTATWSPMKIRSPGLRDSTSMILSFAPSPGRPW